jgi:hypothetical protein
LESSDSKKEHIHFGANHGNTLVCGFAKLRSSVCELSRYSDGGNQLPAKQGIVQGINVSQGTRVLYYLICSLGFPPKWQQFSCRYLTRREIYYIASLLRGRSSLWPEQEPARRLSGEAKELIEVGSTVLPSKRLQKCHRRDGAGQCIPTRLPLSARAAMLFCHQGGMLPDSILQLHDGQNHLLFARPVRSRLPSFNFSGRVTQASGSLRALQGAEIGRQ